MEKIVCNLCGKDDFKTLRGLKMHQRNCKGSIKEEIQEVVQYNVIQTPVEDIKELVEPLSVKSDRELLLEEVKLFLSTIKGSRITKEQADMIMDYYTKVTGKKSLDSKCPSCLSQAFQTLKLNVK